MSCRDTIGTGVKVGRELYIRDCPAKVGTVGNYVQGTVLATSLTSNLMQCLYGNCGSGLHVVSLSSSVGHFVERSSCGCPGLGSAQR